MGEGYSREAYVAGQDELEGVKRAALSMEDSVNTLDNRIKELEAKKKEIDKEIEMVKKSLGNAGMALAFKKMDVGMAEGRLDEMLGQSNEEAVVLNEEYDRLLTAPEKDQRAVEDFEKDKLGMKKGDGLSAQ